MHAQKGRAGPVSSEIFTGFEVVAHWEGHTLVRFFSTDSEGRQVGPDLSNRILNSFEFLLFMCSPGHRGAIAARARRVEKGA
jgi:hypothetical protein